MKAIVAVYGKFTDERARLVAALKRSVERNSPELKVEFVHPEPPPPDALDRFLPKLRAWEAGVNHTDDDVLLLDADTLILGDVTTLSRESFHLAHAMRPGQYPVNTGVVFVRPCVRTRRFMREWRHLTEYWQSTKALRNQARAEYAGTDQAAFVDALAAHQLNVLPLDYTEWNLCQDFQRMTDNTRILHLKGKIHRACLAGRYENLHPNVIREWKKYDVETLG